MSALPQHFLKQSIVTPNDPQVIIERIVNLSHALSELGILTTPSRNSFSHLRNADALAHLMASQKLSSFEFLCQQPAKNKHRTNISDKQSLKRLLKMNGYSFSQEAYLKIDSDDIIEVYLPDFTQFCCSTNLLGFLSYSLEELLYQPLFALYSRPEIIDKYLVKKFTAILNTGSETFLDCQDVPVHEVTEVSSPKKYVAQVRQRFMFSATSHQYEQPLILCVYKILNHHSILKDKPSLSAQI